MPATKHMHCNIPIALHEEVSAKASHVGRGLTEVTIEGLNVMNEFLGAGKDNATLTLNYRDGRTPKQFVLDSLG